MAAVRSSKLLVTTASKSLMVALAGMPVSTRFSPEICFSRVFWPSLSVPIPTASMRFPAFFSSFA